MATIFFAGDDFSVEVKDGTRLQDAVDEYQPDILFGCREGACATCLIVVNTGAENLSAITEEEEVMLTPEEMSSGLRLACQCRIERGAISIQSAESI